MDGATSGRLKRNGLHVVVEHNFSPKQGEIERLDLVVSRVGELDCYRAASSKRKAMGFNLFVKCYSHRLGGFVVKNDPRGLISRPVLQALLRRPYHIADNVGGIAGHFNYLNRRNASANSI